MTSSGIRRKVDDLGRVVIPAGIRRALGIREGDPVEVTVEGERVVLAKPRDACVFCGREEDRLTGFRGRLVCRDCLASLGAVDERVRATDAAQRPPTDTSRDPQPLPSWDAPARPAGPARPAAPDGPTRTGPPHPPAPASTPAVDTPRPAPAARRPHVPERPTQQRPDAESEPAADATEEAEGEDAADRRPPSPPYDPASTTAW